MARAAFTTGLEQIFLCDGIAALAAGTVVLALMRRKRHHNTHSTTEATSPS